MKMTNRFKAVLSIVLVITMLLSVAVVGMTGVFAADAVSITYSFAYENAGYAEGRIRLTANSTADYGTYYLYWADDTKALDGYAPIKALTLNQSSKSFAMGTFTAIPADATKLIAIKSNTEPSVKTVAAAAAVYDIPAEKQFASASSEKEYTFQTLSDIHFHRDNYEAYKYAADHLTKALNAAEARGAEFVSTCGDQVNYGEVSEYTNYLKTIANSNFTGPVYEVNGNHETYQDGTVPNSTHTNYLNRYKIATGLNVRTNAMNSELYYEVTINGDHHIYLALELVNHEFSPAISDNFTKAQMDWLEGLLNKYKDDGHKIFIYEHAPFLGYGAGDNKVTPHYGAAMTINKELYPQTYRFKELLEANKDVIWFNGHTHIDFMYNYNIDNEGGTSAYSVHVPSCASTTTVNSSNGLDYVGKADSSQGYFVDVYGDAVVLNGTDLVKNEIMPLYTYLVDHSGEELIKSEVDPGEDDGFEKVSVSVNVAALVENPAKVTLSLYGADDDTLNKAIVMEKGADGNYHADATTEFTKMKFVVNNGTVDIFSKEYTLTSGLVTLAGVRVAVDPKNIQSKDGGLAPTSWTNANVYVWSTAGGEAVKWPGMAMTKQSDGTYTAVVPEGNDSIIFNNGTAQTDDLKVVDYVVGEVEPPTEATEPPTEATEPPTEATEPPTTEATEPPTEPVVYLYGDADLNGIVNVKDATTVQKYAADLVELEGVAFEQANVSGDKAVNVRDATAIQKYVAGLITKFPADKSGVAEVGASATEIDALKSTVKNTLANEYYYSSYVAYAALKKAYKADSSDASYYDNLNAALSDYNKMKTNNPDHIGGSSGGSSSSDRYLAGEFNGWSTTETPFVAKNAGDSTVYVTLTLEANTTYEFKVIRAGTWTSCKDTLSITGTVSGLTFSSSIQGNCSITTTVAGEYEFAFGLNNSQLSVTYPS